MDTHKRFLCLSKLCTMGKNIVEIEACVEICSRHVYPVVTVSI